MEMVRPKADQVCHMALIRDLSPTIPVMFSKSASVTILYFGVGVQDLPFLSFDLDRNPPHQTTKIDRSKHNYPLPLLFAANTQLTPVTF